MASLKHVASVKSSSDLALAGPNKRPILQRIGWQATVTLFVTLLSVLAVCGFLGFLWFADIGQPVWHNIMIQGWATRSVSISTLVLRFAIDLQAGIAAAMLAALVLESSTVLLHDTVKVSTMRATYPQPRAILDLIPAMLGSKLSATRSNCVGKISPFLRSLYSCSTENGNSVKKYQYLRHLSR